MLAMPTIAVRRVPEKTAVTNGGGVYRPLSWGPPPSSRSTRGMSAPTASPATRPQGLSGAASAEPSCASGEADLVRAGSNGADSAIAAPSHIPDDLVVEAGCAPSPYCAGMPPILDLGPDELLSTTRSVRKRLDLERPVEPELIRECVEMAAQAPTGGNAQGWHFVVVTDAAKRAQLGEWYRDGFQMF